MQQSSPRCSNCAFTRRSLHHEQQYRSSALLERLRTSNFPATDQEIMHIRYTILPIVSADITSIKSKIASFQEAIRSMEEERQRLVNVHTKYNNLISLHRTLPSEIWSKIFQCTLSNGSDFNAFDTYGSMWRLSHVCQNWRNIVLSLQSFWSTMRLYLPEDARDERDVERSEAVIHRSRHGLLNIWLSGSTQTPNSNFLILKRMLDVALAESYRWRELHVSDWRGDLLYASLPNCLPRLESVSLHCDLELEEPSVVPAFKGCPCLRKLSLGGRPPVVECPWGQITELDLSSIDKEGDEEDRMACMRVIGLCSSSLETLSVPYWRTEDGEDESPYTPTTCPNLRKLCAASMRIIDALTLPRLREFSLRPYLARRRDNAFRSVEQLLIRSDSLSTLTSLSLASVPLSASPGGTLHSLLSQTHCLSSLDLAVLVQEFDDDTDASDREQIVAIVKSLEVVPEKLVTFLPRLSSLHIQIRNHRDDLHLPYFGPVGSFASTVKARWRGDNTIGLAKLVSCHFTVQVEHLQYTLYRHETLVSQRVFVEAEKSSFNLVVDEGMDLTIQITSALTAGKRVLFAVGS